MTTLYNYMAHGFLESLLTRGIYFGVANRFDDPWEGHQPRGPVQALTDAIDDHARALGGTIAPELLTSFSGLTDALAEASHNRTFISCWHANDRFSPRMSNQYGKGGIYVRTSPTRILLALRDAAPALPMLLNQVSNDSESPFHRVRYLADIDSPDERTAMDDLLALTFHRNKRSQWEYQREWRLVIDASTIAVRTGLSVNGAIAPSGTDEYRIPLDGLTLDRETDGSVDRMYLKVTPSFLVEEIGVTDSATFDDVAAVCARFALAPPRMVTPEEWNTLQDG